MALNVPFRLMPTYLHSASPDGSTWHRHIVVLGTAAAKRSMYSSAQHLCVWLLGNVGSQDVTPSLFVGPAVPRLIILGSTP